MNKMKELKKQETVKKTRAVNPEIIVRMIDDHPYYSIRYFDLDDCRLHVGYSSYKLEFVVEWLRECFDIVNTKSGWIPVSERLPKQDEESEYYNSVIVTLDNGRVAEGCYIDKEKEWWADAPDGEHYSENVTGHVIAWMPLPEPYRQEYPSLMPLPEYCIPEAHETKNRTNADRIRSMTDEELAEWLHNISQDYDDEQEPIVSIYNLNTEKEEVIHDSYGELLKWLQQEVEEQK